jgi:hypothetical protein
MERGREREREVWTHRAPETGLEYVGRCGAMKEGSPAPAPATTGPCARHRNRNYSEPDLSSPFLRPGDEDDTQSLT